MPGEEVPERNEALERLRAEIAAIQIATNRPTRRRRGPLIAGLVAAAVAIGGGIAFANRDTTRAPSADSQSAVTSATTSTESASAVTNPGGAPVANTDRAATSAPFATSAAEPAQPQSDSSTLTSDAATASDATAATDPPPTNSATTTSVGPTTTAKQPPDTVPALLQGVLGVNELPPNYSVFANGTMHNYGTVVSANQAEAVTSKFAAIVPVDDNFVIDPSGEPATGIVYVPAGVLFASGSAQVGTEFRTTLDLATAFMQFFPQVKMTIIGHTDDVGTDTRNLALSQARARAAVTFMVSQGVDPARLTAEGRGESDPVAPNDTEFGRLANRRIEFVLAGLLDS